MALLACLFPSLAFADAGLVAALRGHIEVLASDAFEGRQPGTPGEARTLDYLSTALAGAGVKPGAAGGGWLQPLRLSERTPEATRLTILDPRRGRRDVPGEVMLAGREAAVRLSGAPLIYAGFARAADIAGAELTGAVVIYRTELPGDAAAPTTSERRELLHRRGAAAVIAVSQRTPWPRVLDYARAGTTSLVGPGVPADLPLRGAASPVTARAILRAAGANEALYGSAARPGFRAVRLPAMVEVEATSRVRTIASHNVIGTIPGRDPRGEATVLIAHWDHLGRCGPAQAQDRICNGAVDNASGLAALIEIARALARDPPQRDTLILATTAEEAGHLGAEAFALAPPRPLRRIVAAINIDTIALLGAGAPVGILSRGADPALDRVVDEAAVRLGRRLTPDRWSMELIDRQDGWALTRRGVPATVIGGGIGERAALERFFATTYHTPQDDMAHLPPLDGAAEDVALHIAVMQGLGDRDRFPAGARP